MSDEDRQYEQQTWRQTCASAIIRALRDYTKNDSEYPDAKDWIFDVESDDIDAEALTFAAACDIVEIDPDVIRFWLKKASSHDLLKLDARLNRKALPEPNDEEIDFDDVFDY